MSVAALSLLVLGLAVGIGVFGARAVGAVTVVDSLLSGYVVTFGVVVLLVLGLSLAHALTSAALLTGLVGALFAVVVIGRLRSRSGCASVRGLWRGALATTRSEPLLAPLFALVAGTVAYSIALAIGTPPTNWDSLTYHLARIGFWLQQGSVSYIGNAYNQGLNAYPPNGEIGQLLVFRTTGDERLMGLVQLVAAVVCAVGVYGLARRLARPRPEAAFGAGLFLTLPVVLLEESTTQNDLIVASLLVSASFFLAGPSRRDHVVAALAVALAMGTKLTGIYALPILIVFALVAPPASMRLGRCVAVAAGALTGSYWYVVNLVETGHVLGKFDAASSTAFLQLRSNITTAFDLLLDSIDLSSAEGADIRLYLIAGIATAVCFAVVSRGAASPVERLSGGALALAAGVMPFVLVVVYSLLFRTLTRLIGIWNGPSLYDHQYAVSRRRQRQLLMVRAAPPATRRRNGACLHRTSLPRPRLTPDALMAAAPLVSLVLVAATITYTPFHGRYFIFPVALSATQWGRILAWRRPIAAGCVGVAATTALLCLVHFYEKPAGIQLLEDATTPSIWGQPRWQAQSAIRTEMEPVLRYLEENVPSSAHIGLAFAPDDWGYPPFGSKLTRTVSLVPSNGTVPTPHPDWLVVSPSRHVRLSASMLDRCLAQHEIGLDDPPQTEPSMLTKVGSCFDRLLWMCSGRGLEHRPRYRPPSRFR